MNDSDSDSDSHASSCESIFSKLDIALDEPFNDKIQYDFEVMVQRRSLYQIVKILSKLSYPRVQEIFIKAHTLIHSTFFQI